jgi:hypothetical protein
MNRRRLLYGLGLATVGSSATALTGATLSNTVSPAADFRVNVNAGLLVEAGAIFDERNLEDGATSTGITSGIYTDSEGNNVYFTRDSAFSFNGPDSDFRGRTQSVTGEDTDTDETTVPEFIVNDTTKTNEDLQFAASVPYLDGSYNVFFQDAIKVTNNTGAKVDLGFAFESDTESGYGADVGDGQVLSKDQLKDLIRIKATDQSTIDNQVDLFSGANRISPEPEASSPGTVDMPHGATIHVHVGFVVSGFTGQGTKTALEDHTTNPDNNETTLDLLDTLFIGDVSV